MFVPLMSNSLVRFYSSMSSLSYFIKSSTSLNFITIIAFSVLLNDVDLKILLLNSSIAF